MDAISNFFQWVIKFNDSQPYIDLVVIVLIIAGGFFAKKYFAWSKWPTAILTLCVGTVFVVGYLVCLKMSGALLKTDFVKYFISYTIATSFYELVLSWFIEWVGNITDKIKNRNKP